ncbi:MAG: hypothetical protein GY866_40065 [Proteobacteria bacterium]|nr:hypothetical protein [Pseudomonadota bacterium]
MFRVGDTICYLDTNAENNVASQGMILEIKEQIKISYHNTNGQEIIWVDASEIELIDTSRCAHNSECGWCDDTGKCFYE